MESESNDLFDDPSFEEKTMNKLNQYDVISSKFSQKLETYFKSTNEPSAPYYKAAEQAWRANPTVNPNVYPGGPVSPPAMRAFYSKCDAICGSPNESATPAEMIRAMYAANVGSKFITSALLTKNPERPIEYVDMIGYSVDLLLQYYNDTSQRTKFAMNPASLPTPGDILTYIDKDSNIVQTILIKNISNDIKGRFYVVTTIIDEEEDDDSLDKEVSEDMIMEWLRNSIPSQ